MKHWRLLVFALVGFAQLAVPASLIWKRERTLRQGHVWKFRTAPVDPVDAFRGRYVALEFEAEGRGEGLEFGGVFVADDLGFGVDAGFQGVERGDGLAFGGSGAGGFLRVQPVGVDLCLG